MTEQAQDFALRELRPGDKVAGLSLGDPEFTPLKIFLEKHAKIFHEQHLAKTYCVFDCSLSREKLVGYVTLVCGEIVVEDGQKLLPEKIKFPYNSYPAIKIARLAVHKDYRGIQLGRNLVDFALGTTKVEVCPRVGCRFVVVDSKKNSVPFYKEYGFTLIDTPENRERSESVMFIDLWKAKSAS